MINIESQTCETLETRKLTSEENDLRYKELYSKIILDNLNNNLRVLNNPSLPCGITITKIDDNYSIDEKIYIEVNCKGLLGKHFCEITPSETVTFNKGQKILVEGEDCIDIAEVVDYGEIIKLKVKTEDGQTRKLSKFLKFFDSEDEEKYLKNLNDELKARPLFLESVQKFELGMKLVDIHYQFDRKKLFFFYTADGRIDFRELAKGLAAQFRTRIELRQIGVRDEAKVKGGIGTCGREFCCSSFLENFKRITTKIANDQNASSNLSKISGPCGKLKCCLSFESDAQVVVEE